MNPFQFPHAQCTKCGKMIRGSHENEVYNERRDAAGGIEPVYSADSERVYYQDEAEAKGLPYNVGSSMCTDCYQDTYRRYQESKKQVEAKKGLQTGRYAQIRENRRLHQEKIDAQIAARKEEQEAAKRARNAYSLGATPRPPIVEDTPALPPVEAEARARRSYKRRRTS